MPLPARLYGLFYPLRLPALWLGVAVLFSVPAPAQTVTLPTAFFSLKTNGDQAAFLTRFIKDSVRKKSPAQVPAMCHLALGLAQQTTPDSVSPQLYQYLADAYDGKQGDSAAFYYRKALQNVSRSPSLNKLYLLQSLLYEYSFLDNKDSVLSYIHQLEQAIIPLPDTSKKKLTIVNTIASSYGGLNQYENAIRNFKFVIQQSIKRKDSTVLRNAFVNTGLTYNETGNNRMAIYYTLQALPYLGNDVNDQMTTYANLADYYTSFSNIDSAVLYLAKAEKLAKESGDPDAIHSIALRRANVFMLQKRYTEAEPLLQRSLAFYKDQPPATTIVNCLLLYATLDTAQNNFSRANSHLLQLYGITKTMNQKAYTAENLRMLALVNNHLGNYKEAVGYLTGFIAVNDSIKADKAIQGLAELEAQYQGYKKEEQIKNLQQSARIQELELGAARRNKTLFIVISLLILAAAATIIYLRHLRSKTALQNLKGELEMKALRSQMNPHFIFNSLNSIQKYIWENRREDASEYLTQFARLIRLVLENSLHATVPLSEELAALRIYVEMEHRRNNQKFDYSITVADNVPAGEVRVPPLLLQPYVENAIWHGLSRKEDRGKLSIRIEKTEAALVCTVDDDGIGRQLSAQLKTDTGKTSLAMNISSQRIAWLQKDAGMQAAVMVVDKYSGATAGGTTVTLRLPLIIAHD